MAPPNDSISIESIGLSLKASIVPWDTEIFQYPVAQIDRINISDQKLFAKEYRRFESWRDANNLGLISCRLGHNQLRETMLLEENEFRFIEMVLHPKLESLDELDIPHQCLEVIPADQHDLCAIRIIAESAFNNERFHVDPRLDPHCANLRYGRWISNSLEHPRQRLLKIIDDGKLVGFFIVELKEDRSVYWHLTAVSPQYQGKGYGRMTWLAMLQYHQQNGQTSVSTTISARNTVVLNLYSSLDFRFLPPEMTFHWVRK